MTENDVVIFMGDSGAYVSNNYFPSPIHRPGVARMCARWKPGAPARISTPFFLRGSGATVLRPALITPSCALPPMTVADLDNNINGCRDTMPWKLNNKYYIHAKYSK